MYGVMKLTTDKLLDRPNSFVQSKSIETDHKFDLFFQDKYFKKYLTCPLLQFLKNYEFTFS